MRRKLGKIETAAALSGEYAIWNIVGVLRLEGIPTPETVRQALDLLQSRHPFLKVRLIRVEGQHFFEAGDVPPIPLTVIEKGPIDQWVPIAEDELNFKFDHPTGPLLKCTLLINDNDSGEIILTAQHSIVDGASIEALCDDLLTLCAAITSGDQVENEKIAQLPPVESRFSSEFQGFQLFRKSMGYFGNQMMDELHYNLAIRNHRKPPINQDVRGKIIQLKTPVAETSTLIKRARKERVTLNSLINAAILISVQKSLYAGAARPYRYMSMADLRPYVTPPPERDQIGCYLAPLRYTISIQAEDNLWSLAHKINDQIYQSTKRGEKYLASVMTDSVIKMTFGMKKFRMATTAISYGGGTTIQKDYGSYKVTSVHGFVSNFGLGPEFSGRVGLYNDELIWDMLYLDTDLGIEKAAEIVAEIQALIN
jgi:hypothetical protein